MTNPSADAFFVAISIATGGYFDPDDTVSKPGDIKYVRSGAAPIPQKGLPADILKASC